MQAMFENFDTFHCCMIHIKSYESLNKKFGEDNLEPNNSEQKLKLRNKDLY